MLLMVEAHQKWEADVIRDCALRFQNRPESPMRKLAKDSARKLSESRVNDQTGRVETA